MAGSTAATEQELEKEPLIDLNRILDEGREMTALMLVCENIDAAEMVRTLVEDLGVAVNAASHERSISALHVACRAGNDAAVQILLDADADIFRRDLCGRLPVHLAAMSCGLRTVRALLRRGGAALLDTKDGSGYTPLMTAAEYGRKDIVQFFMAQQADKVEGNRLMHTAIELADWYGHNDIVKALDPAAIPSTEWPGGAGPLSIANITAAAHAHGKKLPPGFAGSGASTTAAAGGTEGASGEPSTTAAPGAAAGGGGGEASTAEEGAAAGGGGAEGGGDASTGPGGGGTAAGGSAKMDDAD